MEAITRLRDSADAVRTMGATSLYLFGSTARDEARADSDLDLFIDYDPASRFNAFDLVGIKLLLEDRLGTAIDVTTRDGLHPRLRDRIEASALRVF
jgi:predicted nucleotidyltransferase